MKTMKHVTVLFTALVVCALLITACEGPAGPQGAQGARGEGTVLNITITGQASSADISGAIAAAVAGATGGPPWTVLVNGTDVDLTNDYTVKSLIHGIADGLNGDPFSLDLTGCTGYAWGYVSGISAADKAQITAITLPLSVTEITGGVSGAGAFAGFSNLAGVTATGLTDLGDYAFEGCSALTTVSLPATTIGNNAFYGCTTLGTVSLPQATKIGNYAFSGAPLTTVSLPQATTIGNYAFRNCAALPSVSLAATSIGDYAFYGCTTLGTVNLPQATDIGSNAFYGCTVLATVSLPVATSIGDYAFSDCTALATVSLPQATSIGNYAFYSTGGTDLTLTLGSTPPAVGTNLFQGITSSTPNIPKAVTVKRPSSAQTAYGDDTVTTGNTTTNNWGNAFRGKGWNGSYLTGAVNQYVTVSFVDL